MLRRLSGQCNILLSSQALKPHHKRYLSDRVAKTTQDQYITPKTILNQCPGTSLNISKSAADRLGEIYRKNQSSLRILVESGGCHGFHYLLKLEKPSNSSGFDNTIDSCTQSGDDFDNFNTVDDVIYILPENNGKVVIDQESQKILKNTTLIYTQELIGSSFKIIGGSMKSSCGCGSSFSLES